MDHFQAIPYLKEIVIILVAAGIIVPLFNRLRISPVIGYLIVGFLVGPHGVGASVLSGEFGTRYLTMPNPADVAHLAEFGVVFLLFMIGLELSPQRLWAMRRLVFGLGSLQFLLSTVVITLCALAFGNDVSASVILGSCLALSSTAIVMQILMDRQLVTTTLGRAGFSVLLFQDLAVVPVLILVGLLGNEGADVGAAILVALVKALAAISLLLLIGHFLLRPLYRLASAAKGAEPFMAITLLTVIVAAMITGMAGLSMALGAFLGGLLLAETEYRHAIEVYIEPFKGLLLGLFFMTVGMGFDPSVITQDIWWVGVSVIGLMAIKTGITFGLGIMFKLPKGVAFENALLLSQAGEFAFVIIGAAIAVHVIPAPMGQFMLVVTGLSMVATPGLAILGRKIGAWFDFRENIRSFGSAPQTVPDMRDHVIIAGFGRVGRAVSKILDAESIPYLAIETDAAIVAAQRKKNKPVMFGDASHGEMMKHLHPETARAIVVSMSDPKMATRTVQNMRHLWPNVPVFARAHDLKTARHLYRAGSTSVVAETIEASLQLATNLLHGIGIQEEAIVQRMKIEHEAALNLIYVEKS